MRPTQIALACSLAAGGVAAAGLTGGVAAQDTPLLGPPPADTVMVIPGAEYRTGSFRRTLMGDGWRELWLTPVAAPVFRFDRFAGGVDWTERGGGNQSITLHLEAEDGWREYIFRSVNKFPARALPPELEGTTIGGFVQGFIGSLFPAAPLVAPPFVDAAGLLHVEPVLRVMPDDPRLGEHRETFAGMLGTAEIQPNEGPDDTPGYAGSSKIKGTEEFFNDLEASKQHRLDEREFLAARLVDFLINDTDRTRDNMRWARYGREGDYRWRPLPIDRDWAFVDARGWIPAIARTFYPKLAAFGPELPPLRVATYSAFLLDRRLLQRLTREDFQEVARQVSHAMTDDVIETAIAGMPEAWRTDTEAPARIREAIRARREALPAMADAFYAMLAREVDLRATAEPERATIERLDDGAVRVTITWPAGHERAGEPFYQRTFVPSETEEVWIDLAGGNDVARVTGRGSSAILIRVVGGEGDDRLADEAGGDATYFYDAEGANRIERSARTRVSERDWEPPEPTEGIRLGSSWSPQWGGSRGWSFVLDYGDVAGVIVGAGPRWTEHGFRRLPHRWELGARLLYATGENGLGGDLSVDYRVENSPLAVTLYARGVTFDGFRFHGLGNETPDAGDVSLVERDLVTVRPALSWQIGWRERERAKTFDAEAEAAVGDSIRSLVGELSAGPVLLWTDPRPDPASPYATAVPADERTYVRSGLRTTLRLDRTDRDAVPRKGWRVEAAGAGYPEGGQLDAAFAEGSARVATYLPLLRQGTHLAVRAGGSAVTAGAPLQHTAWVGGRTTLRGYDWQRYRGDAAAFGSLELRVPIAPLEALLRWDLGIFGLADAGRVWVDGDSTGGWHTGFGGGLWLNALDWGGSVAYAYGEESRLYAQLGMSF